MVNVALHFRERGSSRTSTPVHLEAADDLYFIRSIASNAVKIGRTRNVRGRMRELQVGNHERLDLWVRLPGRGSEEKEWHRVFAADRKRGEWFDISPALFMGVIRARWGERWQDAPKQVAQGGRGASV